MLFTITTTHTPATDLGYLLHKHPARVQTFDLSFGQAHAFYPETDQAATPEAFEVLHFIAAKRLAAGRLTVIDATNAQP